MYISRFETQISRFFPTHFQTSRFGSFRGWKFCTYGGGGGGGGGGLWECIFELFYDTT